MRLRLLFVFLFAASFGFSQVTAPPESLGGVLAKASDFKDISSVEQIPDAIVAYCTDPEGRLANPDQLWEVSDDVRDPSLPMARLVWARSNGEYYVVHHEHGGIAHYYRVTIAKVTGTDQKPVVSWGGVSWHNVVVESRLKDYSAFLTKFKKLEAERAAWPKTIAEAVDQILEGMKSKDKVEVKATKKEDLIQYHMGWGTGIRNEFGLWRGNDALMKDCKADHPDDASMVIINAVWERLQQ